VSAGLTPEQVESLAAAIGLTIATNDLADVTVRLNATLESLTALDRRENIGVESAAPAPRGGSRTVPGASELLS
jgi:hypothetical protein